MDYLNFIYSFVFVFGLVIGSFLNCVIYRLEEGKSFLKGRSFCPKCKHILGWQDLIPVLSFIFLKGKCRYCNKKVSWQYPLVEFATGILFLLVCLNFGIWNLEPFYYLLISSLLIIIFVFDLKHYIIPDGVVYTAIVASFAYNLVYSLFAIHNPQFFLQSLLAAFLAAGFFLLIVLVSKGQWMGVGDIKLAFLMGLFLGWPNILIALFSAFFIGAVVGIGLIILKKKGLKSEVPFGPFLAIGTFLALFSGGGILTWYFGLFLVK